jgi:hypothetical protein
VRTFESQYDPRRETVTLVAQEGFGGDRYAVTVPATSPEEAAMYAASEEG